MLKKEIGSLYIHYLEKQMGHYDSFRNFCCKKMIYFSFVYGRNGVHIDATPDKYKISEESSNKIRDIVKNEFANLKEISKSETDKLKSYISIVYVDDTTEYYSYNENIAKAFEIKEKIKEGYDVISEPYLIYDDTNYNKNVRSMISISNLIKDKKIDEIIEYLSSNFEMNFTFNHFNKTVSNIKELKQLYKQFTGLFGLKLASHSIYIIKLGVTENGNAKVNLGVEIRGKNYRINCICNFKFNDNNKITSVSIMECDDVYRTGKILTDDSIKRIVSGDYNDINDIGNKKYADIQETNKDPNSIYRIQK